MHKLERIQAQFDAEGETIKAGSRAFDYPVADDGRMHAIDWLIVAYMVTGAAYVILDQFGVFA